MVDEGNVSHGALRPNLMVRLLIRLAQRVSHNAPGRHVAHVIRGLVLATSRMPVDVSVGRIRMRCFLRDNHSEKKFVFTPRWFDPAEREFLAHELPRGAVFVDIGANVGIYTLTAALQIGSAGRILAVEPNPEMLERLRFNISATRPGFSEWPAIDLLQLGISDRSEELELHLDTSNLGASSIVGDRPGGHGIRVECRPLDEVLQQNGVERIDVLKIDIEGAEDRALIPFLASAGTARLPQHVIVERSEHLWQRDLPQALARRGYRPRFSSRLNTVFSLYPSDA